LAGLVIESSSPAETRRTGERLGKLLRPGDVLLLQGELGAGKTVLAQGIGRGLNVKEPVKSSSFVLVNEYHGRLPMFHADLYRLTDPGEVADLALEEVAAPGALAIEWPERSWEELPPEHLLVKMEETGSRTRRISITGRGARYEALQQEIALKTAT
jgi:tRNA threonylcarbamoyladenosine biosynthesis protein TsaE